MREANQQTSESAWQSGARCNFLYSGAVQTMIFASTKSHLWNANSYNDIRPKLKFYLCFPLPDRP